MTDAGIVVAITATKKEETKAKRLQQIIQRLDENKKPMWCAKFTIVFYVLGHRLYEKYGFIKVDTVFYKLEI